MGTAAASQAGEAPQPAELACRLCAEPVTLVGSPTLEVPLRQAVHTATGRETAPGPGKRESHLAAPIDADLMRVAAARKRGTRS
jgi:hypothetical protein